MVADATAVSEQHAKRVARRRRWAEANRSQENLLHVPGLQADNPSGGTAPMKGARPPLFNPPADAGIFRTAMRPHRLHRNAGRRRSGDSRAFRTGRWPPCYHAGLPGAGAPSRAGAQHARRRRAASRQGRARAPHERRRSNTSVRWRCRAGKRRRLCRAGTFHRLRREPVRQHCADGAGTAAATGDRS